MADTPQDPTPADADGNAWMTTTPGDTLTGVVKEVDTAWSNWRAQGSRDPDAGWYPLLVVEDDNGKQWTLHGFRTVLFNELVKREPVPGERIEVRYEGQGKAAREGQNAPEIYRVTVLGRDPESYKSVYRKLSKSGHGDKGTDTPAAARDEFGF